MLEKEATALAARGRVEEVNDLLDESLALPPEEGRPHGLIMWIVALELRAHGHKHESLAVAERSVGWYRSLPAEVRATPEVRFNLGIAYYVAERWDLAQEHFEALAKDRDHSPALDRRSSSWV